jgi:PilZ domain
MPQDLRERIIPGRNVAKERRNSPRYPFTASCEATEPGSGAKILGRTSDLGRGGCYIDTIGPFPKNTNVLVRIDRENQTLKMSAQVAFSQPGMGMGLAFGEPESEQLIVLDRWIAELSGEPKARAEAAAGDSGNRENPKGGTSQPLYVVNELILLLLQKGVITEEEGKCLLQKLLK